MPRRLVNLVLLAAVAALLASGVIAWLLPQPDAGPLYVTHRVAGLALAAALAWKYGIAARSIRRRGRSMSVWLGLSTALAVTVALAIGIAWTLGLASFDRPLAYSALSLHVIAGLAAAGLVVAHALVRGERRPALVTLASRRAAIRGAALFLVAMAATALVDRVGLARRATGSRHAGSFTGNALPTTIWAFDQIPSVDVASWRLRVGGAIDRATELTYREITAYPRTELAAVLDCTGGWWSEQRWSGVRLADVLAAHGISPAATAVEAISVTGHRWTFDRAEAERALLATHVEGETISAAHGYPLRLVVPDRRGFTWVKWVRDIVVT